jgi:hypothetical protein
MYLFDDDILSMLRLVKRAAGIEGNRDGESGVGISAN